SPRRTMALAQQLYEGIDTDEGRVGLITYMRTDSTHVAVQAQHEARAWITGAYAAEYVPPKPPIYRSRAKNAQEAHEAIRPSAVHRTPDSVRSRLDEAQLRLYELIWRRFVASQMAPARLRRHAADLRAAVGTDDLPYRFRATATRTLFPGYLVVAQDENAPDDATRATLELLERLQEGDPMTLRELRPEQHFTEPPPRYSEATLIRMLEFAITLDAARRPSNRSIWAATPPAAWR
ncbi:MAG: hypothetical protein FJ029_10810, partial [Actinobacteria bacterium]|nr:hypothetical protein [Actinomycetota bacterium]